MNQEEKAVDVNQENIPQEAKSLMWLVNMFPFEVKPRDNVDKMFNAVHLYCKAGAEKIIQMDAELKKLKEEKAFIDHLTSEKRMRVEVDVAEMLPKEGIDEQA